MEGVSRHQARLVVGGLHSESANGDARLCLKALCFHALMIGGLGQGVDLKSFSKNRVKPLLIFVVLLFLGQNYLIPMCYLLFYSQK